MYGYKNSLQNKKLDLGYKNHSIEKNFFFLSNLTSSFVEYLLVISIHIIQLKKTYFLSNLTSSILTGRVFAAQLKSTWSHQNN